MPSFVYDAPDPRFAGTIASLMQRQGESAAQAAARIGDIRARATEQSGQAWAGAAQNIGNTVAAIPGQIQKQQQEKIQQQSEQLDLKTKQRAEDARNALADTMGKTPKLSEDGVSVWDVPAITRTMADKGFGPEAGAAAQHLNGINDGFRQTRAAQLAVAQKGAQAVAAAGNNPPLAHLFLDQLEDNQIYPKEVVQKYRDFIDADPGNTAKLTAYLMGPQKPVIMKEGERGFTESGAPIPGMSVPEDPHKGEYTINGQRFAADGKPIGAVQPQQTVPKGLESKSVLLDGKPAEVTFNPTDGHYRDASGADVSARVKPIPPASMTINPALVPSGDALDMAAKRYLATGELPSMGMGQAGAAARVAVMNRAALIDPQAGLAANKAIYKADSANLQKLQTTEGTLSAFENTAGKNLDQFLALAQKIPDTGMPWLNTPVRLLDQKLVGSSNMAAITAARDVALREIARVTNDPKLSGALTDSARAEVAGLSAKDATLPQIIAVAKVLKQDMANVHLGVNQQIETVKAGLAGHPGAAAVAAPTGGFIEAIDPQGGIHHAPAGTPLPSGWKLK